MHGGFGGAVGTGKGRDQHTGDAADVDHQPLAAPQRRKQRAGDTDQRKHIGFKLALHDLDAAIEQRAHGAVAGIVDENVETAMG